MRAKLLPPNGFPFAVAKYFKFLLNHAFYRLLNLELVELVDDEEIHILDMGVFNDTLLGVDEDVALDGLLAEMGDDLVVVSELQHSPARFIDPANNGFERPQPGPSLRRVLRQV